MYAKKIDRSNVLNILFLCVHNSARSQMAEGLAKNILDNTAIIMSAGSQPSNVNDMAIKVMSEIGIDISGQKSKSIDTIDPSKADRIITLCAEQICPYVSSTVKKEHWPLPDPANFEGSNNERLSKFREIRDELKVRIQELKEKLINQKNDSNPI